MKTLLLTTILLTTILIGCMSVGMGQTKIDRANSSQLMVTTFDTNQSDTTACWVKIAIVDTAYKTMEPREKWISGYLVIFKYKPILINSIAQYRHPSNEYFLYENKKRINYPVTSYIVK